jgi:ComF family protein
MGSSKYIFINKYWEIVKDSIFPEVCICGKWGASICSECRAKVKPYKTQLCPLCKKVSEEGRTCRNCYPKLRLTGVMVYGKHEGLLKDLIWRCKYFFVRDLSKYFAELLAGEFGPELIEKEFVVTAVPISKERALWRGFNQSELIARELAEQTGLEYSTMLKRDVESRAQVGLTRKERLKNIQDKIHIIDGLNVRRKRVLLVDDVITTGATLAECAKVLRKAGASEVWGLVLSRD